MRTSRFWIEIVGLGTAIACALALVIATLGAAAAAVGGHPKSERAEAQHGEVVPAAEAPSVASSSLALQQTRRNGDLLPVRREALCRSRQDRRRLQPYLRARWSYVRSVGWR